MLARPDAALREPPQRIHVVHQARVGMPLLRQLAKAMRQGLDELREGHKALVAAGARPLVDGMDELLAAAEKAPLSTIVEAQQRRVGGLPGNG
jgi:hypothetical protein